MTTIADNIRTQIGTNIASYTQFKVSLELPFTASGEPLYVKNKKTVYVDDEIESKVQLYRTLDQGEVYQTETTVQAFLSLDAKNQPSNIDDVVSAILSARDVVTSTQVNEGEVVSEIEDDVLTYTFEFNIINL
jgi:hypothetical protein